MQTLTSSECLEDGRAKVCVFISSCESTKIVTGCWTTINRRSLESIKKMPHVQRKEKLKQGRRKGTIMPCQGGKPKTHKRKIIPKKVSHCGEGSEPHIRPGNPTKGLEILREYDLEGQWDLIIGLL